MRPRSRLCRAAACWIGLAAALSAGASRAADPAEVPLKRLSLGEVGGWIEVNVHVNGADGRWLIDTGSTRQLVSRAFDERHGLAAQGNSVRADTALGPVQGAELVLPDLQIGGHTHKGQTALRLDDLRPLVGAAGEGLDGILGVPLLAGVSLELDLARWTLAISETVPADCPAGLLPLPLDTHRGLPVIALRLNDAPALPLLLDTGNPAAVVRLVADEPGADEPGVALAGGARLALATRVSVGGWQRAEVPVVRLRAPGLQRALAPRVAGLAGTALLDGTRWLFRLDRRLLCTPADPPPLPGGFGLTLVQRDGGLSIDQVLPGGPAQAAGLRSGDAVRRWAGGGPDGPLRELWARVQGQEELELQAGSPEAPVVRLRRAMFLPRLP